MPTGYTSVVAENENYSFRDFALRCARNFGALCRFREDGLNTPIPKEIMPNEHYRKEYERAKANYKNFINNPPTDADIEAQYNEVVRKEKERASEYAIKNKNTLRRYNSMLQKVRKWQPPTSEHEGLKNFMLNQLEESIKFDIFDYEPKPIDKDEFFFDARSGKSLKEELDFFEEKWKKEVLWVRKSNKWLKVLRESLQDVED